MSVSETVLFASGNPHKVREVANVLAEAGITVIGLDSMQQALEEPTEDADTFEGNAELKARYYARHTGRTALADDSGLEVDALGGAPGVLSARYAGATGSREQIDEANNAKLLHALKDVPEDQRTARFVCAMALCDAETTHLLVRGEIEGRIIDTPRGSNGFGYDPLFDVPELGCTTAELPPERKNAISHRGRAVRKVVDRLRKEQGNGD